MMKIYFAGSIRGGRKDIELYRQIIGHLQCKGVVLTEHIGNGEISPDGETGLSDNEIYSRDLQWLSSSDIIVAEVTSPSLGVGFEIAKAVDQKKKVLCLYRIQPDKKLSAMIGGCPDVRVKEYSNIEEAKQLIDEYLSGLFT